MWPNPQETADCVTFTEEIVNGKLHFLSSVERDGNYSFTNMIKAFVKLYQNEFLMRALYKLSKEKKDLQ